MPRRQERQETSTGRSSSTSPPEDRRFSLTMANTSHEGASSVPRTLSRAAKSRDATGGHPFQRRQCCVGESGRSARTAFGVKQKSPSACRPQRREASPRSARLTHGTPGQPSSATLAVPPATRILPPRCGRWSALDLLPAAVPARPSPAPTGFGAAFRSPGVHSPHGCGPISATAALKRASLECCQLNNQFMIVPRLAIFSQGRQCCQALIAVRG